MACRRQSPAPAPAPAPAHEEGEEPVVAPTAAPKEPPLRPYWTGTSRLKEPPVPLPADVVGMVAHVPEGFDAHRPLHLVIFLHGSEMCVLQLALNGDVRCRPGLPPWIGGGLIARHDDAGTLSLFALPQFSFLSGGTPGRMAQPGYFKRFVQELLQDSFAAGLGGPKTLDDLESITLMAHSAGYLPLVQILEKRDLEDKVRNVVLLDSLYAGYADVYSRWLERGTPEDKQRRKLVSMHGTWGDSVNQANALVHRLRNKAPWVRVAVDPPGALARAIFEHDVVLRKSDVEHSWMVLLYPTKILQGLQLPSRPVSPARRSMEQRRTPEPLAVGETRKGTLTWGDMRLENGSLGHDYGLSLAEGQSVQVTVSGERSWTEPCCSLDTVLQLLVRKGDEESLIAEDDDSGGGFDPQLSFTAPSAGKYVLRVSTHAQGEKRGPYRIAVRGVP
ncbi:MAG: PPC domain-containing protein [Myxococcales bacterium]